MPAQARSPSHRRRFLIGLAAALHVGRRASDAVIVVVFCDGGEKYLSERFWDETETGSVNPGGHR